MAYTYFIPKETFNNFERKIKKLNKLALKLGCKPVRILLMEEFSNVFPDGIKYKDYIKVILEGEAPKLKGWKLCAVITYENVDNCLKKIVKTVPWEEIPQDYLKDGDVCEHCHCNRKRVKSFIVKNEEGTYKQVGSSCLKDFLGHVDPHAFASWSECFFGIVKKDSEKMPLNGQVDGLKLRPYLKVVCAIIEENGYVSKTKAEREMKNPTSTMAFNILVDPKNIGYLNSILECEKHTEKIEKAILWAKGLNSSNNEYEHNLAVIAETEKVSLKTKGYAASLIVAYEKMREKAANVSLSEYIGTLKKREVFDNLFLEKVITLDTDYGVCYLHSFKKGDNIVIWFTSSKKLEEKRSYKLKATVKDHNMYKGEKQTIITRAVVL